MQRMMRFMHFVKLNHVPNHRSFIFVSVNINLIDSKIIIIIIVIIIKIMYMCKLTLKENRERKRERVSVCVWVFFMKMKIKRRRFLRQCLCVLLLFRVNTKRNHLAKIKSTILYNYFCEALIDAQITNHFIFNSKFLFRWIFHQIYQFYTKRCFATNQKLLSDN